MAAGDAGMSMQTALSNDQFRDRSEKNLLKLSLLKTTFGQVYI